MRRVLTLLVLLALPAQANDGPVYGTVTVTDAGSGSSAVWNFQALDAGFVIPPLSLISVQPNGPAYVCVDSHVNASNRAVSCSSTTGVYVGTNDLWPTSCSTKTWPARVVENLTDGGTPFNITPPTCTVACVPASGASVSCKVLPRLGNEGTARTSWMSGGTVSAIGADGGSVSVSRTGWELIQSWQIPAGSTQAWDGGASPNVYLYTDGGFQPGSAIPAAALFDVTPYSATQVICQVAALTAAATLTVHLYPTSNFTSVAAAPALWSDTGAGLAANTAASAFHGVGAGAGSTTLGQFIRDDLMPVAELIDLVATGSPSSTMGALECRLYGRR